MVNYGEGSNLLVDGRQYRLVQFHFHKPSEEAINGERTDMVVHLAAIVGYPACKKWPEEARRTNLDGTHAVLDAMRPEQRLISFSTGSNYGEVVGICDEDTPLNPLSLYGETKTEAERLCMLRENTVALRFATAFGLSTRLRLDLMINDFTYQALVNRYLLVYERHFRRTFIHVRDMARVVPHLWNVWDRARGQKLNVGHESLNLNKEDIARELQKNSTFTCILLKSVKMMIAAIMRSAMPEFGRSVSPPKLTWTGGSPNCYTGSG